jgi:hypothetical protein
MLLHLGLARLRLLRRGQRPSRFTLMILRRGWANESFSADLDYLDEVAARASRDAGPILECGSGLTTLLLGFLAARRGVEVWTLEHDMYWHAKIESLLSKFRVPPVHLELAPLKDFGTFDWYEAPLHRMPREFSLVICDGPPGTTRGGRYGLLPVCNSHLRRQAVILVDDLGRPADAEVVAEWGREAGVHSTIIRHGRKAFAVVTITGTPHGLGVPTG